MAGAYRGYAASNGARSTERLRETSEHGQVGVKLHALDPANAEPPGADSGAGGRRGPCRTG